MKSLIGTLCIYCLFILTNNVVSSYGDDLYPLTIMHTNDFHARFEETNVKGNPCMSGEKCIGGLARVLHTVKRIIKEQEKKKIESLYINAGDNFQGTVWYNIGRWNVTSELMNIQPPDVMVLGNHEFDHGIDGLLPFLNTMDKTEIVVANMDAKGEPQVAKKIKPFTIIKKKYRNIGVIGVIVEEVPDLAATGNLKFRNESEAIIEAARNLKTQDPSVNIIIVVSHVGFDVDKIIAERAGSEVDIIVGGHTHTVLYTGTPPGPEKREDNYPYVYNHPSGNKVLLVQAVCHAKYVGNLTVFFDKAGKVVKYEGAPIYMDTQVEQDKDVLEAMKPWRKLIDEKTKVVVGRTNVDMPKDICRSEECALGNFYTDAMIDAFGDKENCKSGSTWTAAPIALAHAGSLRSPLHQGDIHYSDALLLAPFTNMVVGYDLPGAKLKEALEFSAAPKNEDEKRRFLQMSGVKVTYNMTRPANNRIVDLKVRTNGCPYDSYEDLDENKMYRVASPSFLQGGGDSFKMLRDYAKNINNQKIDLDSLLDFLKKFSPIETKPEGRITIIHKSVIGIIYLFYLFIIINAVPSYGDDLFPLTIAHINDFHARFEETDVEGGTCDPGDKCIGGLARVIRTIKTIFREQREKNIHPLYINAGDNFQGTPWYSVGGWKVTSQLMNIKPPDVMVLGNHEFDNGIDGLVPFLENINSQVVVTNMDATDEPEIRGKYLPSAIVTRDKRKIGVIGVIMEQAKDRSKTGKLKFRNESEAIVETAKKLKENRGANIIIVVSYVGFDVDKVIAEHTGSDVDIIVGGHSHTFLYTGTPPGPEEPEDNYPYVYDHPSGNKVLIVQAACHAKYVGNLTVFFDKDGKVAKYEGAPIYMDSDVEKDKNVLQAMKPWKEIINEKLKNGITDENEADEKDSDESSKKEENDEDEQEYKSNSSKENEKRKGKGKSKGKGKGKEKKKGSRKENSDSSKIIDDETEEKDSEHNGENENPGYENNAQSEGDENEKEDKDETNSDTEEDERQISEEENSNKSSAEEEEGEENEGEENDEEKQDKSELEGNNEKEDKDETNSDTEEDERQNSEEENSNKSNAEEEEGEENEGEENDEEKQDESELEGKNDKEDKDETNSDTEEAERQNSEEENSNNSSAEEEEDEENEGEENDEEKQDESELEGKNEKEDKDETNSDTEEDETQNSEEESSNEGSAEEEEGEENKGEENDEEKQDESELEGKNEKEDKDETNSDTEEDETQNSEEESSNESSAEEEEGEENEGEENDEEKQDESELEGKNEKDDKDETNSDTEEDETQNSEEESSNESSAEEEEGEENEGEENDEEKQDESELEGKNEKEDKDETNNDTEEDERQNSEEENSNESSAEENEREENEGEENEGEENEGEENEGEENEREENDEEQQEEGKLEGNEEEGEEGENENNNNTEDDGIPNNEGYEESDNDQNKENSDEEDKRGNDEEREGSDEENEEVNGEENEETSGEEGKENSDESSEEDSDEESEEDSDEENEVDSDEESEENSDEKSEEDNNTKYGKMDYQLINYIIGLINQYYDYAEQ
ncbi:uncharacterized protein ACN427_010716 [Glossina fuscipes fuscipes]